MSRNALRSSLASGIWMYSSIAREDMCKAFRSLEGGLLGAINLTRPCGQHLLAVIN